MSYAWEVSNADRIASLRWTEEDDEERKAKHAESMRRRDLGYLYLPSSKRLRFRVKTVTLPRVIFQPCWSSRRWRSVT